MAIPVIESIALKVVERLEEIKVVNGYNVTVAEVIRPKKVDDNAMLDYQIRIYQDAATPVPELSCPGNPPAAAFSQPFRIEAVLMPSDTGEKSADELRNEFAADIIKALTVPAASWHNWGNFAINSSIGGPVPAMDGDGGIIGVQITLTVWYRTDENNPYKVR